jgi:hypothetical protein
MEPAFRQSQSDAFPKEPLGLAKEGGQVKVDSIWFQLVVK